MAEKKSFRKILKYVFVLAITVVVFLIFSGIYYSQSDYDPLSLQKKLQNMEIQSINWRFYIRSQLTGSYSQKKWSLTNKGPGAYQNILIAGLDDDAIYYLGKGKYPFNRKVYADMLNNMSSRPADQIPQMVFFDIVFAEPGLSPEGDQAFFDSVKNYKGMVGEDIILDPFTTTLNMETVGASQEGQELLHKMYIKEGLNFYSENAQSLKRFELNFSPEKRKLLDYPNIMKFPVVTPMMSKISTNLSFVGTANVDQEFDTVLKKPLIVWANFFETNTGATNITNVYYPSVILAMALKYYQADLSQVDIKKGTIIIHNALINGKRNDLEIPVDNKWRMSINYKSNPMSGYVHKVSMNDISKTPLSSSNIMFVGFYSEKGPHDIKMSPFGDMYGIEVNAYVLATLIQRDFIRNVPDWINIVYLFLLTLAVGLLVSRGTRQTVYAGFLGIIFPLLLGSFLFFFNLQILTLVPILASVLVLVAVQIYTMLTEQKEKKFIKATFSSYLNPKLVDILIQNPNMINLGGQSKEVTVFFSGVKGLDTITENVTPKVLIDYLNAYFTKMADIILDTSGTLDKYIGDAVMAFWNAPIDIKNHALKACQATIKMLEVLHQFNEEQAKKGFKAVKINIGINTGSIVVGNVGSEQQKNYTAIGDAVNLASRVKGLCKFFHVDAIITEFTYEQVKDFVIARELDLTKVKGKTEPVRIYEILDVKTWE